MPKTRTESERQAKTNEIVDAAVARLRRGGLEAMSIAAIARELGVAQNTIYWYFPSRDHLLVAAMARMAEQSVSIGPEVAPADAQEPPSSKELILIAVDRFAEIQPLRIALRERAQSSAVVRDFQERLQRFLHEALGEAFKGSVPDAEMELAIDTFMIASDGCSARGLSQPERRALLGYVLDRLGVK